MITYKQGNLLSVKEGIIIHGCNAQGVMGSGVARAIKEIYPKVFEAYKTVEATTGLKLGGVSIVRVTETLKVINLISQQYYGTTPNIVYVDYAALETGFRKIYNHLLAHNPKIHIPKIGAGRGNGDWNIISKIIEQEMPTFDITCWEL